MSFIATAVGGIAGGVLGGSAIGAAAGLTAAGGALAGAGIGASLGGAKMSADAQKSAARTAAGGAREEIAYNRETRDLIRKDQEPYRKSGYKALDALMSLTGLGGGLPGASTAQPGDTAGVLGFDNPSIYQNRTPIRILGGSGPRRSAYEQRASGGTTVEGQYYNINELGPESVYTGGEYTRTPNPRTISGTEGYVQPNIQGRALGGPISGDYRPMGMDGQIGGYGPPPNRGPGQTYPNPDMVNTANTTAINPQTGYPNENPGGEPGGYQFETDPGYQFRFSEGQRALDRGAAARGGLLSGGYARKAIRYGQGFASNEFTNVYNRIANIAGLGQTANQTNAQSALYTGAAMGNAASNAANATAYGQIGAGNAWANAGNQIAQLPWGNIFNKGATTGNQGSGLTPVWKQN